MIDEGFFNALLHWTTRSIEVAGIAAIVLGILLATARFGLRHILDSQREMTFQRYRGDVGRSILLGLEFLVAADIINTVAIDPTLESLAVLAGIVLIRTFLSFALEVEIEGRFPWQARPDDQPRR
ncbi:DUF1622 domain-containing protein [Aquibium carbonis]|uniref:DUF1622 domain-containing protein n=1 Tax=Aquibium carbonis TaxID=2495581 RepID=A0A3R9YGI4_9HYPH|nr:DUF1622 domain-containing protein [Aquibium carbonis]RST87095.1 DUF1622 domain-containing protein [Aquibium carbonis]